ncbi:bifunctional enoyl-CoA hydratase/phosphate acetyltransferase [Halolamina pelagica]|uniref:Bifunctional enoyl-CoA hydratase/phosphate acetyltransferase n=1 Tax=Halolamina pelagica TaxID=699431 RepID=A0A0P7HE81_9EURY|nr:MaoC family dehydratase [Halolamina pelagica]KPN31986.1 bifunctional enoyl-CoA hydratase/phosphate acetyltransferase [Halolamina pelagica]
MPVAAAGDDAEVQRDVTRETIEQYADLTGDENRLHTDPEYAAEGFFGGVVAHGMLGAGLISAALAALPGDIVYLSQDLDFAAPVRPGDTVRATAEVVEDVGDDRVRVETVAEVVDGDDAETVIDGEAVVLSVPHEN